MDRVPKYRAYVDWLGHGCLNSGLSGWYVMAGNVSESYEQAYTGRTSIAATSGTQLAKYVPSREGQSYSVSVWVMVPPGQAEAIVSLATPSTEVGTQDVSASGTWERVDFEYTATDNVAYRVNVESSGTYFVGWMEARSSLDDVSKDLLLSRTVPLIVSGRDSARDLAGVRSSEVTVGLKNNSHRYTPTNSGSDLYGLIENNRQIFITAEHKGTIYRLYTGYTDNYIINASIDDMSVTVPCVDELTRLNEDTEVHTELFPSLRTGDAVRAVLRRANLFPLPPEWNSGGQELFIPGIDSGATVLRWWTYAGSALKGIDEIIASEGPPAIYGVCPEGHIVFRDRLHRQRAEYNADPVAVFSMRKEPGKFALDSPSSINYGFEDVVNVVNATYSLNTVDGKYSRVWRRNGDVSIGQDNHSSYRYTGTVSAGFYDAQDPIQGVFTYTENVGPDETNIINGIEPEDYDYVLTGGDVAVNVRTRSGSRVVIDVDDISPTGEYSTVRDMSLIARQVNQEATPATYEDTRSIAEVGGERREDVDFSSATRADVESVSKYILGKRSGKRPMATAVLHNRDSEYMAMLLQLQVGDVVKIEVDHWFMSTNFTVEAMEHELNESGKYHRTVLYLEEAKTEFETDDGQVNISPETVFVLGSSLIGGDDVLTF